MSTNNNNQKSIEELGNYKAKIAKEVCYDGNSHSIMINTNGELIIDGKASSKYKKVHIKPPANKK